MRVRRRTTACILFVSGLVGSQLESAALESHEREAAALDVDRSALMALPLSEAPGATTVITADEIARSGAANIFELLRRVPGVDIRYTPMGGHIGIRSSGSSPFSEQVLLLIDGSPYNSPDKGGFPGHPNYVGFFPLDRIARIEIVKGPVSVLYGANAFGGVINIVSKQALDAVADRVEGNAYGITLVGGERGTFERGGRLSAVRSDWNGTLQAGIDDSDTPIVQNDDADHSRSHVYASGRRGNLWGSFLHQESRHGSIDFEGVPTQIARNNVNIADVHYDRKVGETVLRTSATVNRYHGTTCAECHNSQTAPPDDAYTTDIEKERETDQRLRLALRADRTLTDAQDMTVGIEVMHDSVKRRVVKLQDAPESRDSEGIYFQHQWHLAGRAVHVLTGLRLDHAEGLGSATSPRVAVVAQPSESLTIRGSLSRAYRAPTWNERYRRQRFLPFDIGPNLMLIFQGNPDLERERNDSVELGAAWRANPDLILKVDLYRNRIHDFIGRGEGGFVPGAPGQPNEIRVPYENRKEPYGVTGGELTLLGRPARSLNMAIGYAYRHLGVDENDPVAAYAPRSRVVLTAAWSPLARWSFDLAGSYQSAFQAPDPEAPEPATEPSSVLIDGAVHYLFPVRGGRLQVGLLVRNLTDERAPQAADHAVALRGRTGVVELKWDF